jgi:hypothetical protein
MSPLVMLFFIPGEAFKQKKWKALPWLENLPSENKKLILIFFSS